MLERKRQQTKPMLEIGDRAARLGQRDQALRAAKACGDPYHFAIVDYQMPGTDGAVIAAKMKRLKANVPIMLLSAYGPLPKRKLRSVDTFLSKSQPANILLSRLHELVDGRTKPFFHRWLDQWKSRNQVVKP